MMKQITLAVFVCVPFASVSFAQQSAFGAPASKEAIEKYMEAMRTRDMMNSTLAGWRGRYVK
jgi:hypothetical protein